MDDLDRQILSLLQHDASLSTREIADEVGLTTTPCWRRIQNLETTGVIERRVALVDARSVNLSLTALVMVRTSQHNAAWTQSFLAAVESFEEVIEAYRTSGEVDYLLKVTVPNMDAYDAFYQRLIEHVDLYDVRTTFVMEEMKHTTALPLHYA